MLIEGGSVPQDSVLEFDLCIVGAGPAGIAMADRLRGSALRVCLLESGGFDPELPTQRLYRGEIVGHPYFALDGCRFRLFGGSSNRWGGWCRPLDDHDFERRSWLPWSGWPIGAQDLKPFYNEAVELFQLPTPRFDRAAWDARLPRPFPLESTEFESNVFQYSPESNFGELYRERVLGATNITTLLHANAVDLALAEDGASVAEVRVRVLNGPAFTVRARATVLAAGGIENPRLLLAARRERSAGLGNQHDLVGRFFMEHLHVPAGHFLARRSDLTRDFYRKAVYQGFRARGVLTPSAAAIERHQLLSCSIAVEKVQYGYGTPFLEWSPEVNFGPVRLYRTLRSGRLRPAAEFGKKMAERWYSVPRRWRTWRLSRRAEARARRAGERGPWPLVHSLYFRSEQAPNPASRLMLGERLDALGLPELRLDWKIAPEDTESIARWLRIFDRVVREQGLGIVVMPEEGWARWLIGGPHHMGTTRMAASPLEGVVDADCRVHGLSNLYVAGSSVFTTGGYANPTLTLVALALRLADHLRDRLG